MKSLNKYIFMLDFLNLKTLFHKSKDEDFFVYHYGPDHGIDLAKSIYKAIKTAKSGLITVKKISDNPGIEKYVEHSGITTGFAENIALHISNADGYWFNSSVVQKIDWDKSEFTTMNSVYSFKFEELDDSEAIKQLFSRANDDTSESDDKA